MWLSFRATLLSFSLKHAAFFVRRVRSVYAGRDYLPALSFTQVDFCNRPPLTPFGDWNLNREEQT